MDFQKIFDEINEIHNSYDEKIDLCNTFIENAIMDYKVQIAEEELRVLTESNDTNKNEDMIATAQFVTKLKAALNKIKSSLSVTCAALRSSSKAKSEELKGKIDKIKTAIKENPAIGRIEVKCPDVKALLRKGQETLHKVQASFAKNGSYKLSPELKKEMQETVKLLRSAFNEQSDDYSKYLTDYSLSEITTMVNSSTDAVQQAEATFSNVTNEVVNNIPSDIKTEAEALQYIANSKEFISAYANLIEATVKLDMEAKFAAARLGLEALKKESDSAVASQQNESVAIEPVAPVEEGEDMTKPLVDEFEQLFENAEAPLDEQITLESIEAELFKEKEETPITESVDTFDPDAYLEKLEKSLEENK